MDAEGLSLLRMDCAIGLPDWLSSKTAYTPPVFTSFSVRCKATGFSIAITLTTHIVISTVHKHPKHPLANSQAV